MSETTQQAAQPAENAVAGRAGDRPGGRAPTIRQRARQQAREVSARRREERVREEKRLGEHVATVLTALGERDAVIAETERRAGGALLAMTRDEGLSLRAALEWCGDEVGTREGTRLRRLAEEAPKAEDAQEDVSAIATDDTRSDGSGAAMPRDARTDAAF